MRPGRLIWISVMVVLLLCGDGVVRDDSQAPPIPETTVSSSPTPVTSTPTTKQETPTPTPTPVPATLTPTCSTASGPIVPAWMTIDRLGINNVAVDQKPLDPNGSVPVPTDAKGNDTRWAATWINNTPRPGAAGVADFTTHTFHQGDAVGNRLATTAVVGDTIRLIDAGGKQLCFQISSINLDYPAAKLPVTDLYNAGGPSRMAIVFCTHYNWVTGIWPMRGVVMANLI